MEKARMEKQKEETMYHDIGEKSFYFALNDVNHWMILAPYIFLGRERGISRDVLCIGVSPMQRYQ